MATVEQGPKPRAFSFLDSGVRAECAFSHSTNPTNETNPTNATNPTSQRFNE